MGTDIHGVFQRHDKESGQWVDIASEYEQDRNYRLFAVLAGVRNGTGFAGIRTGEAVRPIAEPRGLPNDFAVDGMTVHTVDSLDCLDPISRKDYQDADVLTVWMGEHAHSWLTGDEMLARYESAPKVINTGILSREVYEKWDGKSFPSWYCAGISGSGVVVVNDNAVEKESTPNWTHIRCTWESELCEDLKYFFDEVARLVSKHGEIRFVFGFDS